MIRPLLVLALGAFATAAAAGEVIVSPSRYQKVHETQGGWTWYVNKDSERQVGTPESRMVRFWMTGENHGPGLHRKAMSEVQIACAYPYFVTLHLTTWDASNRIVSDTVTGNDPSNWREITPGNPAEAARAWVCR